MRSTAATDQAPAGQVVILNGAPRSGKSSIVAAIQETLSGTWLNIGVDVARQMTPAALQPGIGLRPGEAQHPAAPHVVRLYAALYDSIAAHSRLGLCVAVDVGHYDPAILADAAQRLAGLPVLFVGVRCPIDVIMSRRRASEPGIYASAPDGEEIPAPILRWQDAVHGGWRYDLEVDTSDLTPVECAKLIAERIRADPPPIAFAELCLLAS